MEDTYDTIYRYAKGRKREDFFTELFAFTLSANQALCRNFVDFVFANSVAVENEKIIVETQKTFNPNRLDMVIRSPRFMIFLSTSSKLSWVMTNLRGTANSLIKRHRNKST